MKTRSLSATRAPPVAPTLRNSFSSRWHHSDLTYRGERTDTSTATLGSRSTSWSANTSLPWSFGSRQILGVFPEQLGEPDRERMMERGNPAGLSFGQSLIVDVRVADEDVVLEFHDHPGPDEPRRY